MKLSAKMSPDIRSEVKPKTKFEPKNDNAHFACVIRSDSFRFAEQAAALKKFFF